MKKKNKKSKATLAIAAGICAVVLAVALIVLLIVLLMGNESIGEASQVSSESSSQGVSSQSVSSKVDLPSSSEQSSSKEPQEVDAAVSSVPKPSNPELDENYERLLLVNGENPLPKDFDYTSNLITIQSKYICGQRNKMDRDAYTYAKAMLEAAWADGVDLYILSPYRAYADQQILFDNKVQRVIAAGTPKEKAEDEAATVVARPGTSEHHTGLAIDFNSVEESFEDSPMFAWLQEHAEDYGFILRYPKDATDITGVIYEPWHYRFVGIKAARQINELGITLEEYVQTKR